ncbi:MAG: DNA-3-methyladenine glycosylase [Bacteroidota bacterium]
MIRPRRCSVDSSIQNPIAIPSILQQLSILPRSFYLRPTITVARDLLGKYLVRKSGKQVLIGRIVEVEAYLGKRDPASHTFRGKTKRNEVMFREGGHLYVYFTYGMHFCANVVTGQEGIGEAVLLRAVEPVDGIETMSFHRGFGKGENTYNLTNGPAKLCQAFGLNRSDNGTNLLSGNTLIMGTRRKVKESIVATTRIGIRVGNEFKWRFVVRNSGWASRRPPKSSAGN